MGRARGLRALRLAFGNHLRELPLTAHSMVGSFERWHFAWLDGIGCRDLDPVLPAVDAPKADAALADELAAAGATSDAATATVSALRAAARLQAQAMVSAAASMGASPTARTPEAVDIREAPDNTRSGTTAGRLYHISVPSAAGPSPSSPLISPLKISGAQLEKLRALHAQVRGSTVATRSDDEEFHFRRDLVQLLLRYKTIGGSGFQAALGGGAFAVLRRAFGCTAECFASPLNARASPFCSAFPDVDAAFGSVGSFLRFEPDEGSFEANPPFAPNLIEGMCRHMGRLLTRAEAAGKALLFVVIVGASAALRRHSAWASLQRVAAGEFGRAQWLVPLHLHGYTEGHAHIMRGDVREARRMSSCDTAVMVWASSLAAARWPATAEAEAAMRAAMRGTVPHKIKQRASKANRAAHVAKKRKRSAVGGAGASSSAAAKLPRKG